MLQSSNQHKCALIFCAVSLFFLGGGIAASGFIHEFLSPYDDITSPDLVHFTYTQYWLGIPAFVLGLYILMFTLCCKIKCLMACGFVFSALVLVSSICGLVLHGPAWRSSLHAVMVVNDNNCKDDSLGHCSCGNFNNLTSLSCHEIKYVAILYSVITICSALVVLCCQFCCFVYCRVLGCLPHLQHDPIDYYAKTVGTNYTNGYYIGRANEVALNKMN